MILFQVQRDDSISGSNGLFHFRFKRMNSGIQPDKMSSMFNTNQSQFNSIRDPQELDMEMEME
jgi:hypothetical protein